MKVVNLLESSKDSAEDILQQFGDAVKEGFTKEPKKLSSEYFYDDIGSVLFQKITQQEEYYLTRTELEILKDNAKTIPSFFKEKEIDVVELGVGDGHKTKILIQNFIDQGIKVNFYPIDISKKAIVLLEDFIKESDLLAITAVVAKYFEGLKYINDHSTNQKLVLFLGSNIGNTDENKGEDFLKELNKNLSCDDLMLTGLDLIKDEKILNDAYNDKNGYTRSFNMNLLTRMNNDLGANFDLKNFEHLGKFNSKISAMESFLVSATNQEVFFDKLNFKIDFKLGESVHLEYSFKYSPIEIDELAKNTGFKRLKNYTDNMGYFIDSLWQK
jgi:dimethylhistidine N-methyltransferase